MSRKHQSVRAFGSFRLFVLALLFSILCNVYLPGYSQGSTASPREALVIEIREDVALRLDISDEALSHEQIERLYLEDAEAAGLSYKELIKIYEQEFSGQKAAQQLNPWEQFRPNAGWIFGFASLGVVAYTTLLKK